jgi:peptide/nickel transport system permease protein
MNWWAKLRRNPLAQVGFVVLVILYLAVLVADFLSPYAPDEQYRKQALLPPTPLHITDRKLVVYPSRKGPPDLNTGVPKYVEDQANPTEVQFFVQGYPYSFMGLISSNLHLFGTKTTENPAKQGYLFLLGTDEQGRDQFSRLLSGGRISLTIGLIGIGISFPLGLLAGGVSGYFGGIVDNLMMRLTEVLMSVPSLYLFIALAAVLPPQLTSAERFTLITVIISLTSWAGLARVIRGQVLSLKEQEYVEASRAMGGSPMYILFRHILPQTATYIIISATLAIPSFIIAESVLSLIGLGIQEPDASWGNMLVGANSTAKILFNSWLVVAPASLIIITSLAFNFLGDGLRDALDPRNIQR